ncbi:sugar phosphate isomerase/epimerase family protein [Streptomyces tendae]|uniref:sugar phosphate isomerase/epimerase family protein n=1 Tax=Streptomyces tendae TaxID=1932 RepID=UPI00340D2CF0
MNRVTLALDTPAAHVVRAAHGAGFDAVEMSARRLAEALTDPTARELVEQRQIKPVHGGWSIRLAWERENFEKALSMVGREMEFAAQHGSRSGALVFPRSSGTGSSHPVGGDELVDRIGRVADLAARSRLDVVVEFNGLTPSAPGDDCRTLPQAIAAMSAVARRNAGILIDSYHWHASGGVPSDVDQVPDGMPLFVHINDAPALDRSLLTDSMRLLPGQGGIDLTGLLRALHRRAYEGPVSVELKNADLHGRDPREAARLAGDSLRATLRRAELSADASTAAGTQRRDR